MTLVHATCVAVAGQGVLLRGRSGAGKSDLALRLIDGGAVLVADDRVALSLEQGAVIARPPATLAGRLEVRGLGIVPVPWVGEAAVRLVVDLVPAEAVERLPEPDVTAEFGLALPRLLLAPFEASSTAKLRLAVGLLATDRPALRVAGQG